MAGCQIEWVIMVAAGRPDVDVPIRQEKKSAWKVAGKFNETEYDDFDELRAFDRTFWTTFCSFSVLSFAEFRHFQTAFIFSGANEKRLLH